MIIEKIQERLTQFPTYLKYRHSNDHYWLLPILSEIPPMSAEDLFRRFNETGYLVIQRVGEEPEKKHIGYQNFDEWLFGNQHYDLVDYSVFMEEDRTARLSPREFEKLCLQSPLATEY